ncbi:hypothetical protein D1872_242250 [compost metagenome]
MLDVGDERADQRDAQVEGDGDEVSHIIDQPFPKVTRILSFQIIQPQPEVQRLHRHQPDRGQENQKPDPLAPDFQKVGGQRAQHHGRLPSPITCIKMSSSDFLFCSTR